MKLLPPSFLSHKEDGFSLMELLVGIALVAVLVTLSLSATQALRTRGNDVACVSNLRQCHLALMSYFSDHNGKFLPKKYWFQYSSYRQGTSNKGMREYFKIEPDIVPTDQRHAVKTMLTCPSVLRRHPKFADIAFQRGYGINYYLFTTVDDKSGQPIALPGFKNIRNIPQHNAMWVFADGAIEGGADLPEAKQPLGSINDNTAYHNNEYLLYPHSGKRNHFVFLDGHIEGLTKEELRDRPNQRAFWGNTNLSEE